MASKKKQSVQSETEQEQQHAAQQQQIANAYNRGRQEGQQEVWSAVSNFLKERMLAQFVNKNDEIAKELRDLNQIISKNIT